MKKEELVDRIVANSPTPRDKNELLKLKKNELYNIARMPVNTPPLEVENIAKEFGFKVLWLPPYHPMLNPIEEAWGLVKGYVAKENDGSSFMQVKDLILQGFEKVTPEIWSKLIRRTTVHEDNMIKQHHILLRQDVQEMIIDISDTESEGGQSDGEEEVDLELIAGLEDDVPC
jgi:transposase